MFLIPQLCFGGQYLARRQSDEVLGKSPVIILHSFMHYKIKWLGKTIKIDAVINVLALINDFYCELLNICLYRQLVAFD